MSQQNDSSLFPLLLRRCGSYEAAERLLESTAQELGVNEQDLSGNALQAIAIVKTGHPLEGVARALTWREFEAFCANILRASGYQVTENVVLTKPRRQVDIFARSTSFALSVDCKHWKSSIDGSQVAAIARQQLERSAALRRAIEEESPIISVILTMQNEQPKVVDGVAVVPLLSLRGFLNSIDELKSMLSPA